MTNTASQTSSNLTAIGEGIWHVQKSFRIMGLAASSRMTVVRLNNGGLWLHSPVRLSEALQTHLNAVGPVQDIVSPNLGHHLFIADYLKTYPSANLFASQGLSSKRKDLHFATVIHDTLPASWQGSLEQHFLAGAPQVNEWVWLHKASKTLILTDSVQWMQDSALSTQFFAQLMGVRKRPAVSRLFAKLVNDPVAFGQSWKSILEWDFDRVVLGHDCILNSTPQTKVKDTLRIALQKFL